MKSLSTKQITLLIALVLTSGSFANAAQATKKAKARASSTSSSSSSSSSSNQIDASKDIDGLGGNDALVKLADNIDPENSSRIVQKRTVDRHNRFELGASFGNTLGGDSYLKTQSAGANVDFHFNPHWSVGLRYFDYSNSLTSEGERSFQDARAAYLAGGRTYALPDIDYPLQSMMAVVNWYPIYGKTNFFDWKVVQFDMYLLGGAGQIQLSSGWTETYTGGVGVGMWMSQRYSARLEVRDQIYHDQIITGSRNINATVATIGLGILL